MISGPVRFPDPLAAAVSPTASAPAPNGAGHPQLRLLRKVKGGSVSKSFSTPAGLSAPRAPGAQPHSTPKIQPSSSSAWRRWSSVSSGGPAK